MTNRTILTLAVIASTLLGTAAIAQMPEMNMEKMTKMLAAQPGDSEGTKDLKKAHMDMMGNMNMEFTGNTDADFARSMIKHHEGGIAMAKIELEHGKDPMIREMAEKMVKDQGAENEKFKAWLKEQGN